MAPSPCDRRPVEPLWRQPPQTYRGPLINQLIEADRRRQLIDVCDLRSIAMPPDRAPAACPTDRADPRSRPIEPVGEPAPRLAPVQRLYEPVYHLGTMLDVFA